MKRIIYRIDGGISVIIPAPKSQRENETEVNWLKRVFDKATPNGTEYKDTDEILPDRRFRNAWSKGTIKAVEVAITKAKEQVLVELRAARDEELIKTDGLMTRVDEIGTQAEIEDMKSYRQKLRDLPVSINLEVIEDVQTLQNKFPEIISIESLKESGDLPVDYKE